MSTAAASTPSVTIGVGRWADLPKGLLLSVLDRLFSVADLFAVAAVCRSWRALAGPPASAIIGGGRPPLLLRLDPPRCLLLSPADPAASYRCLAPSSTLKDRFLGYSHGHLIFRRRRSSQFLLADVARGDVHRGPTITLDFGVRHAALTAPLSAPGCSLLLLTFSSTLLQWRVSEREWSRHSLEVRVDRITIFRGQIFTLDMEGRLFAIEFSPHFSVRELAVPWPQESSGPSMIFPLPWQLVECGSELMLVGCVPGPPSPTAADMLCPKVEVFRLDLSGPPSWVKMESLGERALFIDELGISVACPNPSRWGGRSNCIYLVRQGNHTWTELPLDGEAIDVYDPKSPLYRSINSSFRTWPVPVWVYPSMLYQVW